MGNFNLIFWLELILNCIYRSNFELQANLEEFVAQEKAEDESDSDDTDSGTMQLWNRWLWLWRR